MKHSAPLKLLWWWTGKSPAIPYCCYTQPISLILFPFAIKELICDRNQFSKEEFQAFIEERKSIIPEMLIGLLKV